ncbi:MAG: T9SS type A sorting domain-containing protein, partial [Roseburia sp.]|nr:T9SS type A sorting domain-containing protein [Roseburia sp.]
SWNKAEALVYEIKNLAEQRNVAVSAAWSHVYNDVREPYAAGNGFSIKTDVKGMPVAGKVLYRLPKDDTAFDYYDESGTIVGDHTAITRPADYGHLNDTHGTITVEAASPGRLFLVGNPFMTHMDMAKFLDANPGLNRKYWIMTAGSQSAAIMDENSNGIAGVGSIALGTVAPLQGFFVEAKEKCGSITLTYDEGMMVSTGFGESGSILRSRADAEPAGMLIQAVRGNDVLCEALVRVAEDASAGYDEGEDVVLFNDPDMAPEALVYTVAGETAATVNTVPTLERTEIGFRAVPEDYVGLRFTDVDIADGYYLFDTSTDEYLPIYEGMEYDVPANPFARLYITRGAAEETLAAIRISVENRNRVHVATGRDSLTVNVYDTLGRLVLSRSENCAEVSFTLDEGVYVVEATDGTDRETSKIIVR